MTGKIKAAFVDTLEYQATLDIMVHLAGMAEMDSKVPKVIEVCLVKEREDRVTMIIFNMTFCPCQH